MKKRNPDRYPKYWDSLAEALKEEANWRCTSCDHPHDSDAGYSLTVHHRDGDPTNNHRSNLEVLCQRCHLIRQGKLRIYGPGCFLGLQLTLPGFERTH